MLLYRVMSEVFRSWHHNYLMVADHFAKAADASIDLTPS